MKAKCKHCGDTIEVTKPREYKSCKCGAINLDYGDEFYYRVGGSTEDFDGEIEDVPKIHDREIYTKVSDPDLETLSNYYADIADCFKQLAYDFSHLSKVMKDRNERYGESHK